MSFTLQTEQWVPYPADAVFAFFANPENLPALMPEWQKVHIDQASIVSPPRAGASTPMAGIGSRITVSFRPVAGLPFRVRWQAEITELIPNTLIADRQIQGPFAFWNHTRRIRSVDRAGINITVIVDQVEYEPRMGFLGRVANALFLRRQLERTFAYRQARLTELLALQLKPVVSIPQQLPKPAKSGKLTA
jgi:ligand-binding SRPBCC domain-containing protein